MTTTYYPLDGAIPASDLKPGMTLHRVARLPMSAVFSDALDALVLEVKPFTHLGIAYVNVVLEPQGPTSTHALNLAADRPVQIA